MAKPRKRAPVIDYVPYSQNPWPEDKRPTPSEQRVAFKFRKMSGNKVPLRDKEGRLMKEEVAVKDNKGNVLRTEKKKIMIDDSRHYQIHGAVLRLFKSMGVPKVEISMEAATEEDLINEKHPNPGVVLHWSYRQKERRPIALDKYTTPLGNLRGCLESIEGMYKIMKHDAHHEFTQAVDRFSSSIGEVIVAKARTKIGLSPQHDWAEILEITQDQIGKRSGLPVDEWLPGKQRKKLSLKYHPDSKTCPDPESMQIINAAAEHVVDAIEGHKLGKEKRDAMREKAGWDAEKRKEEREKRDAQKQTDEPPAAAEGEKPKGPFTWKADDHRDPKILARSQAMMENDDDSDLDDSKVEAELDKMEEMESSEIKAAVNRDVEKMAQD